ncbi:MAG: glycosyltransferase family 39 protein, partial [bacterium]
MLTPGKPGLPGWILPALAALIVFAGTVTHRFVWDDRHIIQHTRQVVRDRGPAALALVTFTERPGERPESSGYFRPVSLVSMWVNDPVGEASPLPYHLVNVLIHAVNSVLVFFFLRLVIPGGHGALAGSALFAVHPVHAESVAWVSGRTDLLAALFLLSAVVLWLRHAGRAPTRKLWPYAAGMAAFAMACLAKETSFLLPGVALLWVLLSGRSPGEATDTPAVGDMRWIPGWFAVLGIVLLVRSSFLGIGVGPGWSTQNLWSWSGAIDLAGTVAGNLLTYLRFLLLPWPLAVYYPPGQPGVTATTVVAAAAFLALCLGLSGRRHRRMGLLGLVWTLGFLAPVSGVANLGLSA